MEPYQLIKRNEILLIDAKMSINFDNIILKESQSQKTNIVQFHLYKNSKIAKSIDTESRLVVT